jgi:ketosteroid isomerase-like protein
MPPDPVEFSRRWAAAWNARDLDAVLAFFHDGVTFTSPFAAEVLPESGGVICGKHQLREYWSMGL